MHSSWYDSTRGPYDSTPPGYAHVLPYGCACMIIAYECGHTLVSSGSTSAIQHLRIGVLSWTWDTIMRSRTSARFSDASPLVEIFVQFGD